MITIAEPQQDVLTSILIWKQNQDTIPSKLAQSRRPVHAKLMENRGLERNVAVSKEEPTASSLDHHSALAKSCSDHFDAGIL